MKKALLSKLGEILGIVEVLDSQKTVKVCDGFTSKIKINSVEKKYTESSNCKLFDGVNIDYSISNDTPLNLRELKLSSSKKILNSTAFKEAYYLTVQDGIVDLSK